MTPDNRLIGIAAAIGVLGIAVSLDWINALAWNSIAFVALAAAVTDFLMMRSEPPPRIERKVAGSMALGARNQIDLEVENPLGRLRTTTLHDIHPVKCGTDGLPLSARLPAQSRSLWHYTLIPEQRGEHHFDRVHCTVRSPFGLWWRRYRTAEPATVRVYPNFAAVSRYALLAMENRLTDIGVRKRRRRGIGSEFQQLREFRQGDSLRQVDWKATARTRKLISKEYQDERDQTVIFLLDAGRRMRARDDGISHFDAALNSVLLLAYVALHKGDAVGVGTFGGAARWFTPAKGQAAVSRIMNQLYDLEPTVEAPDYPRAATELLARQKKRALVIVVTNLRDEDTDDMRAAVHALKKRHSVLVASTRESVVDGIMERPVHGLSDALRLAAGQQYRQHRLRYLKELRANGVDCLDAPPESLSVDLVNAYLAMKAGGKA